MIPKIKIGAGPSGATAGFYLCQEKINGREVKVICFDKQKFPRDKICGNAVTTLAQKHLKRMGIMKEIEEEGECHWVKYLFFSLFFDLKAKKKKN